VAVEKPSDAAYCNEDDLRGATVDELPCSVWLADPDGSIRFASSLWDELLGTHAGKGPNARWVERLASIDPATAERLRRRIVAGEDWEEELRLPDEDGVVRTLLVRGHAVRDADGTLECWIGVVLDISRRAALRRQQVREAWDEGRLGERQRIARSLHSGVQQLLYAAKTHLTILRRAKSLAHAKDIAETARGLVDEAIRISRDLIVDMGPQDLEEFRSRLAWVAQWMRDSHGLEVDLHVDGTAEDLPPKTLELVLEAARECLFNVVKHAETDQVRVEVNLRPDVIELAVVDYGIGCDPAIAAERIDTEAAHFGLSDMRARCEALGGAFAFESAPHRGTTVLLRWPRC
jgi:PAS domain S-box-containing protein